MSQLSKRDGSFGKLKVEVQIHLDKTDRKTE